MINYFFTCTISKYCQHRAVYTSYINFDRTSLPEEIPTSNMSTIHLRPNKVDETAVISKLNRREHFVIDVPGRVYFNNNDDKNVCEWED